MKITCLQRKNNLKYFDFHTQKYVVEFMRKMCNAVNSFWNTLSKHYTKFHCKEYNEMLQTDRHDGVIALTSLKIQTLWYCHHQTVFIYSPVLYSSVQHSRVQHSTVQQSTVQYSIAQYSTIQYCKVQHSRVQHSIVQQSTAQYSTVEYCTAE